MEFAVHMRNEKTGEKRIKKVVAENIDGAHWSGFGYKSEWVWEGTEPFRNISEKVKHIGNGFYVKL